MATIGTDIEKAVYWLEKGEVVAIPTETVYGLAGNIYNEGAIAKIYAAKARPRTNPLIVHVADIAAAEALVTEFPPVARELATAFWPGPLTMIFPKSETVPDSITAGEKTVAIRIPDHPLTLALLKATGFPLAAPSANPYNYISPVTAAQVNDMLGDKIPYILDGGRCTKGIESTILAVQQDGQVQLLRPGALNVNLIEEKINTTVGQKTKESPAHAGMSKVHYSPRTPLYLFGTGTDPVQERTGEKTAYLFFKEKRSGIPDDRQWVLSSGGDPSEAAWNLYDSLYMLDQGGFGSIMAELLPETGAGLAVNDRLRKAAQPYIGK